MTVRGKSTVKPVVVRGPAGQSKLALVVGERLTLLHSSCHIGPSRYFAPPVDRKSFLKNDLRCRVSNRDAAVAGRIAPFSERHSAVDCVAIRCNAISTTPSVSNRESNAASVQRNSCRRHKLASIVSSLELPLCPHNRSEQPNLPLKSRLRHVCLAKKRACQSHDGSTSARDT